MMAIFPVAPKNPIVLGADTQIKLKIGAWMSIVVLIAGLTGGLYVTWGTIDSRIHTMESKMDMIELKMGLYEARVDTFPPPHQ